MNTIAHLTAGYSLTKFLIKLEDSPQIKKHEKDWIAWGVFCSQIPDFDEIFGFFLSSKMRHKVIHDGSDHHGSLMHLPIFYFAAFASFGLTLKAFRGNDFHSFLDSEDTFFAFKVFIANVSLHLVMDSLGMGQGLRWLFPFRTKQIGIALTHKIGPEDWKEFYTTPRVLFEIIVFLISGIELFWEKYSHSLLGKMRS